MTADVEAGSDVLVLSAAPGAGKTTVIEQWSEQRRAAGEIVIAVGAGRPGGPADLRPGLRAAISGAVPAPLAATMIRALEEAMQVGEAGLASEGLRGEPVWFVLDDAQKWTTPEAAGQIRGLLAAAGPGLRVILGSRSTPHGLLSRMLLEGRAKEYRMVDLAFDREEARELLDEDVGDVSEEDVDSLLERTAGWAAGLRLATLAMARLEDHTVFVHTFAGTDRAVSDYLVAAVLSGLPESHLEVLLGVSSAERVTLDLARLLTGRPDAGAVLDELVDQNMLVGVDPHDSDWYVIHPLLRSYLRAVSRSRDEARHRRRQASVVDWFEGIGDPRSAIEHAAAAGDWPRVEALLAAYSVHLAMVDGPAVVRQIWQGLPAWLQARPPVATSAALIASLDGSPAAADLELSVLDAAKDDAPRQLALRAMSALAGARRSTMDRRAVADAVASLDLVAGTDADLAILGRSQAVMALAMVGDLDRAETTGIAVGQLCRTRGLDYTLFRTLIALTGVCAFGSNFTGAAVHGREAIELAQRRGWDSDPLLTSVHGQLALEAWLRYDQCSAAGHAQRAVEVSDTAADPISATAAQCQYDILVTTRDAGVDLTVLAHFRAFNEVWSALPPLVVAINACFELMISLRHHELGLAGEIVRQTAELIPDAVEVPMLRAMRSVYQGHESQARVDLDAALADESAFLSPWTAATAWALAAHVADVAGEPARTHDALLNAVRLVEPVGLARVLLGTTPSTRALLQRHQGRFGRYESYVAQIIAMDDVPARTGTGVALTEKELMVLRDLPSMLSLREIADAHVVSVNTIKSHLKSVYRKLGAVSRREAVDLGRDLGLI